MLKKLIAIARKTGRVLAALARSFNRYAEDQTVLAYEQAEQRISRRGDFSNVVGILFGDEQVRNDFDRVSTWGPAVRDIKARRAAEVLA